MGAATIPGSRGIRDNAPVSAPAPAFSEREFYRREFRGRTIAVAVSVPVDPGEVGGALDELASAGARVLLLAPSAGLLRPLGAGVALREDDARLEGEVWRALRRSPRAGVAVAGSERPARACGALALRLGIFKLVWLDPQGGLRRAGGERASFVHLAELEALLADPGRLEGSGRIALWEDAAEILRAGLPALNVCSPAGLEDELFTYAGSGTLFTRERYVGVRKLGVDDYDAASDLVGRGVAEGYLAPRDEAEVDRLLAHGLGAFVEGRDLAGIASLLPGGDGRSAEIAGLYTLTRFLGEGVGNALVAGAVERARRGGLEAVFACTTSERVGAFFERNGFSPVRAEALPAAKWSGYDPERRARVRCYRLGLRGQPGTAHGDAGGGL